MAKYPYIIGWVWQNASHSGAYGRGALARPDIGETMNAYLVFAGHSKGWMVWIAVIIALLWIARKSIDARLVVFSAVAALITLLLPFRMPQQTRYFLPAGVALIGLVAAARAVPRAAAIVACALAGILLAKNLTDDVRNHRAKIEGQTTLRRQIDAAVQQVAPPGGIVIYGWRVPEPSFALRVEATEPRQLDEIAARYPREGHFNDWERRVYLPPGATRWDVAVVQSSLVDQFPEPLGRPVAEIGAYRVFTNPR